MKWRGRGSGGGESCYFRHTREKENSKELLQILHTHNVSPAEWLLLAAMEGGSKQLKGAKLPHWFAEDAHREFGMAIPDEEYRTGLEKCLRRGWLRILDRDAVAEVHTLLQDDPVFLAIPKEARIAPKGCHYRCEKDFQMGKRIAIPNPPESRWGETDFSPAGAELYRTISAQWLGPGWEDALDVSKTLYWEEHSYCESMDTFQEVVQEHLANGRFVRASRIVPIRPWCVHWWERFPAGYRLELEIDESDGGFPVPSLSKDSNT